MFDLQFNYKFENIENQKYLKPIYSVAKDIVSKMMIFFLKPQYISP